MHSQVHTVLCTRLCSTNNYTLDSSRHANNMMTDLLETSKLWYIVIKYFHMKKVTLDIFK